MQLAARRPAMSMGAALVGASVFAASAVSPMPDVHLPPMNLRALHVSEVGLAALVNPLAAYENVFQHAAANVDTLVANTVPFQLLNQIVANQLAGAQDLVTQLQTTGGAIGTALSQVPAALSTAVGQLTAGNLAGAVNTLVGIPLAVVGPAIDLLPAIGSIITTPLHNVVNVINAFTSSPLDTLLAVSGLIAPLISTTGAIVAAVQNVVNAVGTGDLGAVVNSIVTAPATVVDGLLNGGYGPDLSPVAGVDLGLPILAGGLLSSADVIDDVNGNPYVNVGGPIYSIQQILKMITRAITPPTPEPPPTTGIAAIPAMGQATLTLTAASAASATGTETAKFGAGAADVTDGASGAGRSTGARPADGADDPAIPAAPATTTPPTTTPEAATPTTTPKAAKDSGENASIATPSKTTDAAEAPPAKASAPTGADTTTGADANTGHEVTPKSISGSGAQKADGTAGATTPDHGPSGSAGASAGTVHQSSTPRAAG